LRRDRNAENQYKVQAGDTLAEIAAELNVSAPALRKANAIISDNELYPGRWLNLPTAGDAVAEEPAAVAPSPSAAASVGQTSPPKKEYVVAKGDTAWAISRKLNVSFSDLMKLNGINRPESLQIGQRLKIPGAR
jgi:LysM repeat protein